MRDAPRFTISRRTVNIITLRSAFWRPLLMLVTIVNTK